MVKNEADIIEAFVRHHLRLFDRLWVIDNVSTDQTREILQALRDEGLPLRVTLEPRTPNPQQQVMTEVVTTWAGQIDWLFLLDADEFVDSPSREALVNVLSVLDPHSCYLVPWSYMVPTPQDDPSQPDPRLRITHRRDAPTPKYLSKVVLPSSLIGRPGLRVARGNHLLESRSEITHTTLDTLSIAHFPIRSAQQLARKAVIGAWGAASRNSRRAGEHHHFRTLRDSVLAGPGLTPQDLQRAAANYAEPGQWIDWPLVEQPLLPTPEAALRHSREELDWRSAAIAYADAHFRELDVQILDEPLLVKSVRGVVAVPPGTLADLLRTHGDWAPDLLDLVACLTEPGDVIVQQSPGVGYLTVGLATLATVIALADEDESWLRTNVLLTKSDRVRFGPLPDAANVLVATDPSVPAPRMLLLGEHVQPPANSRQLRLQVRQEPYHNHLTGEPVVSTRSPLPAVLALAAHDPLCEDLLPYLDAQDLDPGHRWDAHQVIAALMMRRHEREQPSARTLTDLERRLELERQLRADPVVMELLLSGRTEDIPARIREFQADVSDPAVRQLELQLRHEAARTGYATSARPPESPGNLGPLDPARLQEILLDMDGPPSPLRALGEFEPVSGPRRNGEAAGSHLLDHPDSAVAVLAEIRRSRLHAWLVDRLGGPVVLVLETAAPDAGSADAGIGCAVAVSGEVAVIAPGIGLGAGTVIELWFFPAAHPPSGKPAILV